MSSFRRAALVAAAQLFVVANATTADTPEISAALVEELHIWIDAASDLPRAREPASIVFAERSDVSDPGELASMIGTEPRGLYDPMIGEITLVLPWNASNPQDISVLLHELVHHRQNDRHYYCPAAKEQTAYTLQRDWLAERGMGLDVNWIAVILASSCAPRDVHPRVAD